MYRLKQIWDSPAIEVLLGLITVINIMVLLMTFLHWRESGGWNGL